MALEKGQELISLDTYASIICVCFIRDRVRLNCRIPRDGCRWLFSRIWCDVISGNDTSVRRPLRIYANFQLSFFGIQYKSQAVCVSQSTSVLLSVGINNASVFLSYDVLPWGCSFFIFYSPFYSSRLRPLPVTLINRYLFLLWGVFSSEIESLTAMNDCFVVGVFINRDAKVSVWHGSKLFWVNIQLSWWSRSE